MTAGDETRRDRELAERLRDERPVPAPGFRGSLRRHLLGAQENRAARPQRLRLLVALYAGSGLGLLALAAIGVAGAGPLAA